MNERDIIEAFRAGDDLAFVSIYNRYKSGIYSFCLKMTMDREAALDLMQDTFLRVYENRDRLINTSSFKSWLFTIARNQCLNRLRRSRKEVRIDPEVHRLPSRFDGPAELLEKSERVELVNHYLTTLSPSYREVLVLREYQNLTYEEIAAVTRSTISAVKSRLFKARRKLAAQMRTAEDRQVGKQQYRTVK